MSDNQYNIHSELIERCKRFDQTAQKEIYGLYAKAMLNTAYRITSNIEDAEDVLQESFVSAFKNIHSFRGDASFGAWLKRIVINRAINLTRKQVILETEEEESTFDPFNDERTDSELVEKVKAAILELLSGFRQVFSLYCMEGYDHKEIAEILQITESTSKTQYKRAKERIKKMIEVS